MRFPGRPQPIPPPARAGGRAQPSGNALILRLITALLLATPATGKNPSQAASAPRPASLAKASRIQADAYSACGAVIDHLSTLVKRRIPASGKIDMTRYLCTDAQYHLAFYLQGIDRYNRGDTEGALLFFHLSKDMPGLWQEADIYYLWKCYGRLGDSGTRKEMAREMETRFPGSPFLARMKDPEAAPAGSTGFLAMSSLGGASGNEPGAGGKAQSYLSVSRSGAFGRHDLEAAASLYGGIGVSALNRGSFSYEGSLEYDFAGFRAEASLGRTRSYRPEAASDASGTPAQAFAETTYWSLGAAQSISLPARLRLNLELSGMSYGREYGSAQGRIGLRRKWNDLSLGLEAGLEKQVYGYDLCFEEPQAAGGILCQAEKSWHTQGEAATTLGWEGRRNRLRATLRARLTRQEGRRESPEREGALIGYHALTLTPSWLIAETLEGGCRYAGTSRRPYYGYRISLVFRK